MTSGSEPPPRDWMRGLKRVHILFARMVADIDRRLPRSQATVTERRILVALGMVQTATDVQLATALGLDRSQLSRVVASLVAEGSIEHRPNPKHVGQRLLSLTEGGQLRARALDAEWTAALQSQYDLLPAGDQRLVLAAMGAGYTDPSELGRYFEVQYTPMKPRDFGWVLNQAAGRAEGNEKYVAEFARDIAGFAVSEEYSCYGAIAKCANATVGSCIILPLRENELHARVTCLFVAPQFESRGIEDGLLRMCLSHAEEVGLLGVHATARADAMALDGLFRRWKFKRSRQTIESGRHGRIQKWRSYEIRPPFL